MPREALKGDGDPGSADLHHVMSRAARFFEQNLADNARARKYVDGARNRCKNQLRDSPWGMHPIPGMPCSAASDRSKTERRQLLQLGLIIERDRRARRARGGLLRSIPRSADVSDSRFARPRHRIRRTDHRSGRTEVPEFAGNAAVSQGPRTLRTVRGAAGATRISSD